MSNTPRSQAAEIYRSEGVCPFEPAAPSGDTDPQKISHYGYMGRIIEESVEGFLGAYGARTTAGTVAGSAALSGAMTCTFGEALAAQDPEVHQAEWDYLEASQAERYARHPGRWPDAHKTLEVGFANFARLTTPHLYDALKDIYDQGERVACVPENWPLLYSLASLNSRQLDVFGNYFFLRQPEKLRHCIGARDINDGAKHLRFKEGFPENVRISRSFDPQGLTKPGKKSYSLGSVRADGPTVGCPIIFKPKLVRDLWTLYVTERQRIEA